MLGIGTARADLTCGPTTTCGTPSNCQAYGRHRIRVCRHHHHNDGGPDPWFGMSTLPMRISKYRWSLP